MEKTIYVDMDDVICETCRGLLKLLQGEFGRSVAYEDVREFDLRKSFDMSTAEIEEFLARAHQPDILAALVPLPGALDTLGKWVSAGNRIHIMTGRPPSTRVVTEEWLTRHEVGHQGLTFVDKYSRREFDPSFNDAMTLPELAAERFCLAIEDSGATAEFLAENAVAPVVLLDRPWNRGKVNTGIQRMADWGELGRNCTPPCR